MSATVEQPIVIIGGGHAGIQLCGALVAANPGLALHLVCEESELPYQRPPLSKAFLKKPDAALQPHRSEAWLESQGITVYGGDAAEAIDRNRRIVRLRSGRELPYSRLVLATGSRARRLPQIPPGLANVAALRSAADAMRLRSLIDGCQRLTVLGGGFIGLEVAATARALGRQVEVLEAAPRLLMRSVSPELATHVLAQHRAAGIDIRLGSRVGAAQVEGDRLAALEIDGRLEAIDTLLLGIGGEAEQGLAQAAGLQCENGIIVDRHLQSSDPAILAIGDCARFPAPHAGGKMLRLESVPNAADQARTAAATLLGAPQAYAALPWFWSEQGSMRLQMAGLIPSESEGQRHRRPGPDDGSFSILHYSNGRLAAVESVNAPADHIAARKLLQFKLSPPPGQVCDSGCPLASLLDI